MSEVTTELQNLTNEFLRVHTQKEDLFWETKMGLSTNPKESQRKLSAAEIEVQDFAQNPNLLKTLRELGSTIKSTQHDEQIALNGWIEYFKANAIEDELAQRISAKLIELEGTLQEARAAMNLGYIDPRTGEFHAATSTLLVNMQRMDNDEAMRKAAFEGVLTIEPFVLRHGFLEIVKMRNELGRMLGYEDYYDMKVQRAEGITKKALFALLDDLEMKTRDRAKACIEEFIAANGPSAREPWNYGYLRSGDLAKEQDVYFPFSKSLDRWTRSFCALGIKYRGATLTLDLIDRKGKYENGFMHGPVPAFYNNGKWNPARINFTANAMPDKIGSGSRAIATLFHEGGHAAHFSNILMNAPCFSQEFAPTSVAYAETQSMFLDSFNGDPAWLTRYAKSADGKTMPFDLIERLIRNAQPFESFDIRMMLIVCYAEKMLYEMKEEELTEENVLAQFRALEQRILFLNGSPRPILTIPHLLAGESSAYYHGYVLAEMAVYQTRAYFMEKFGYLTDNPNVGPELASVYWAPGNSVPFMTLVERLTGKPFGPDDLVAKANRSTEQALAEARAKVAKLDEIPEFTGQLDLDADVKVIHGNELITEFHNGTEFAKANTVFENWVETHFPQSPSN